MLKHMTSILTYAFLYLAVVLLWVPPFKKMALWIPALLISLVFGLVSQRVDWVV